MVGEMNCMTLFIIKKIFTVYCGLTSMVYSILC